MLNRLRLAFLVTAAFTTGVATAQAPGEPALTSTRFNCDAVTVAQPLERQVARDLEPAHDLPAVEAVLNRHKVPFERSRGMMAMNGVPQAVMDQINTLPQGEPIVLPDGEGVAICVLRPSEDSI